MSIMKAAANQSSSVGMAKIMAHVGLRGRNADFRHQRLRLAADASAIFLQHLVFPFARHVSERGHGPDGFRFSKLKWKTERVAIAYRLLFAYPLCPSGVLSKIAHIYRLFVTGSLAIVTLCSVTASFMTCYLRGKTTEAPAISTRPGLPTFRAWTVGGRSQRGPLLNCGPNALYQGPSSITEIKYHYNEFRLASCALGLAVKRAEIQNSSLPGVASAARAPTSRRC